jgi:hypothetical protein
MIVIFVVNFYVINYFIFTVGLIKLVSEFFSMKLTRRLRFRSLFFHLSEFENAVPLFFLRRQCVDFALEVKFHLSEFENAIPSFFCEGNAYTSLRSQVSP